MKISAPAWVTRSGTVIRRLIGGRSNVYLISHGDRTMLVDTCTRRDRLKLVRALDRLGIRRIDYLLLTHIHFDHVENARFIQGQYGASILAAQGAEPLLLSGQNEMIRGTNLFSALVAKCAMRLPGLNRYEGCAVDIPVAGDRDLEAMGFTARIVATPGHSPFSISLVVGDQIAVAGDSLFGVFPSSAFPPFAQDTKELVASWGRLLDSGCRTFLPGHGNPVPRDLLASEYKRRSRTYSSN